MRVNRWPKKVGGKDDRREIHRDGKWNKSGRSEKQVEGTSDVRSAGWRCSQPESSTSLKDSIR